MAQKNRGPESLKEYYIAYFDLLGYKEYFREHSDKVMEYLHTIYEAISNTNYYIQSIRASIVGGELGKLSIRTKVFSDNVLLCMETGSGQMEYPRFLAFLTIVADIQRNIILKYGLFLRGGVTIGSLSFNDDFVFGQGLIDVVELENTAIYPRIIFGKAAMNYILQPHFVDQDDLKKACDTERRAHSGIYITDEELAFCNSMMPAVEKEKFYLRWRDNVLLLWSDGTVSLNYFYCSCIDNMLDRTTIEQLLAVLKEISPEDYQRVCATSPDQMKLLEQHKNQIIEKLKEYGQYSDLDVSSLQGTKDAELREYILKKYLWVMMFHNYVCIRSNAPEHMIKSGSTCDIRFMRMTVEIYEDDSPKAKKVDKT